MLHRAPYARTLVRSAHLAAVHERVEEKVTARLARARLFEGDHSTPEYWAILHESLLTDPILSPREMAEQLDQIVELTERHRIVPQVIPRKAGP
ncbi:XRE family transcriptional regulator OS=Streptomyces canus OX=58343 GN=AQI96_19105 PE=4 SV=1 [Streptomyces canus]